MSVLVEITHTMMNHSQISVLFLCTLYFCINKKRCIVIVLQSALCWQMHRIHKSVANSAWANPLPSCKKQIVWIHRFCLRKITKCTKPLECWPRKRITALLAFVRVCTRAQGPFCSYIQALDNIGDPWNTHNCNQWPFFPSLCLSLKHTYYFTVHSTGLLASMSHCSTLSIFSSLSLLTDSSCEVHQNWQSTHLCASCSLSFLIYSYYSSRWNFANYDHNHEMNHPQCLFLVKGLC